MQQIRLFVGLLAFVIAMSSCASARKAKVRQDKIDMVINMAKSFIGTPYKWGGTSRTGMDCSGLLHNSYTSVGFPIPRTSALQSKIGFKVKKRKIEEGDLVFFATGKKRRQITHVGLVTSARGGKVKFIHSSSSLGVVESNLDSEYYKKRFITARRPF